MTQPPLTRQIQLLEHELGVQLLERSGGGVRLTAAGCVFQREAEDILRRAQAATKAARRAIQANSGNITMAFVPPASFSLLPGLLAACRSALPDVHMVLREMQTDDQLEALGANRVALGVVRPFAPRSFTASTLLLREPMVLALPAGHFLAGRGTVPLAALERQPFIEFCSSESRYLYEIVAGRLRSEGVAPFVVQSLSHTHTILSLVNAAWGAAVVPQSAMSLRFERVVFCEIENSMGLHAELHLAWRRAGQDDLIDQVRHVLCATCCPFSSSEL